jgi:hypothetical protein
MHDAGTEKFESDCRTVGVKLPPFLQNLMNNFKGKRRRKFISGLVAVVVNIQIDLLLPHKAGGDGSILRNVDKIRRHTDNRKLLLIRILLLSHSFIFFRFSFLSIYGCIPV